MVLYICNKCNKNFKQKSHYINHTVNKKKPCKIETGNLNNENNVDLTSENNKSQDEYNLDSITSANSKIYHKCDYCDKFFTRKDSLAKHIRTSCKNKKGDAELESLKELLNNAFKEIEKIKTENELLKNCIPHITNTKSNNTGNSINNGVVNNSVVNNGLINSGNTINIVQFGKEDLSKMDFIEAMNVFLQSTGGNIIANMLKHINFNPAYPENYNICMTDLAREIVKIYNGEKFVCKKFKTVKDQIIGIISKHINGLCANYKKDIRSKNSEDILKKININNISLRLINNEDFEDLIKDDNNKQNNKIINKYSEKILDDETSSDDISNEQICNSDSTSDYETTSKMSNKNNNKNVKNNTDTDSDDELNDFQLEKIAHLESKRQGLIEITGDKLKDELYNNRKLVEKLHKN